MLFSCFFVVTSCDANDEVLPKTDLKESLGNKSAYSSITLTNKSNLSLSGLNLSQLNIQPSRVAAYQTTTYLIGSTQYAANMLITNELNGVSQVIILDPNSKDVYSRITLENGLDGVKNVTYATGTGEVYMRASWDGTLIAIKYIAPELLNKGFAGRFNDCVGETIHTIAHSYFWSGIFTVGMAVGASEAIIAGMAIGCTARAIARR